MGDFADWLVSAIDWLHEYIWYVAFIFLVAAGIFFCIRFRGLQLSKIPMQAKLVIADNVLAKGKNKTVSSFQAFCVSMGARIGIGNIVGVATAIISGGPGAIFWMWIFAIIGASTSFVETTLGQIFKEKKSDGGFHGGPAYYIKNGLKNHKFAIVIAMWVIITYGITFSGVQVANSYDMFSQLPDLKGKAYAGVAVGLIFAAFTAYLVFGGIKRIARASQFLVPLMAFVWIVMSMLAIILNYQNIGNAVNLIFTNAFTLPAGAGGFAGWCVIWGLKRGVFSNEAGIGSVPNLSSEADVSHPAIQGHIQSISVLIVTLVVCSLSAFTILTFFGSDLHGITDGGELIKGALNGTFGGNIPFYVLTIILFMFAFSSLIAYYSMAETNMRFIKDDDRLVLGIRLVMVATVFISCIIPLGIVWQITDISMAIMGMMNIYSIMKLWKYAYVANKDFYKQRSNGVETPVFDKKVLSDAGLDVTGVALWESEK